MLNAYIKEVTGSQSTYITTQMMNKELAINFGYDGCWCDVYVITEHIENVLKSIKEQIENFNKLED